MRFGSLFSGIGGMDLGLERAGFQCAWQVEIDEYATRVLTKHWPSVPRFRDVRDVGRHNLDPVDLIAGGFPCQDISLASSVGAGIIGERSGLWTEFERVVREIRPRYVLIENVPALRGRGLALVLQNLWALGYDAEWHCIPASAFGAPHERDRIWIVAYLASVGRGTGRPGRFDSSDSREQSEASPDADFNSKPLVRAAIPRSERHAWAVEPDVVRVVHGVPSRVDRIRGLGNAVVPQVAEWIGRRILESVNANAWDAGT